MVQNLFGDDLALSSDDSVPSRMQFRLLTISFLTQQKNTRGFNDPFVLPTKSVFSSHGYPWERRMCNKVLTLGKRRGLLSLILHSAVETRAASIVAASRREPHGSQFYSWQLVLARDVNHAIQNVAHYPVSLQYCTSFLSQDCTCETARPHSLVGVDQHHEEKGTALWSEGKFLREWGLDST